MLSKLMVSEVLATSAGLSIYEVEAACDELIAAERVYSDDGWWTAFDLAVLYLRLTAPHVPMDRFNWEIAHATLSGAVIDGLIFTDRKELAAWPYTRPLFRHSATTLLYQHLSCLEAGDSETTDKYEISHIAVHESGSGYCLSLSASWDATGNAPSGIACLFGDASAFLNGRRATSIPVLALSALGEALKHSHEHTNQKSTGPGAQDSLSVPGSLSVH